MQHEIISSQLKRLEETKVSVTIRRDMELFWICVK